MEIWRAVKRLRATKTNVILLNKREVRIAPHRLLFYSVIQIRASKFSPKYSICFSVILLFLTSK